MDARLVWVACLALLLSGCVSGAAKTSASADVAPAGPQAPATASDWKGAIDGVVVDESLFPIGLANVSLSNAAATDAEPQRIAADQGGHFVFSLLDPGTYRLRAEAPSYGAGTVLVSVAAGEVSQAKVIIHGIPTQEPYLDLFLKRGILQCAFSAVAWADTCTVEEAMGENKNEFDFNISVGHQYLVVETDWANNQLTMDHDFYVRKDTEKPRGDLIGRGFGKPILRVPFWPGKVYQGTVADARVEFPPTTESLVFRTTTWYDGQYQQEVNGAVGPGCAYMLLGYCTGVGADLSMTFTEYVSVFMNGVPEGVETFSAVPDS